jgi:hypothetical protein
MPSLRLAAVLVAATLGLGGAAPEGPRFAFPLDCVIGRNCEIQHYVDRDPGPGVLDYRCQHRTYQGHDAVDIRIPDMAAQARGVAVLAAAPGKVLRVRDGVEDVSARTVGVAAVDAIGCGNAVVIDHGGGWISGYCHMAKGSVRVKPGDAVTTGQPIGRVGLSGLTEFPHLHFMVRHNNQVVDPFAPGPVSAGACPVQAGLWTPQAARAMSYKPGAILNIGVTGVAVTAAGLEAGSLPGVTAASPVIAAYGRVIEAQAGDVIEISLTGPDGAVLATQRLPPLDRDKAQYFQMVGKKRPATGWPTGPYTADFRVLRGGKVALQKRAVAML